MPENQPGETERGARWWPIVFWFFIVLAVLTYTWWVGDGQRRVMVSIASLMITLPLSLLWLLFFSRTRWRTRILGTAALLALLAGFALSFTITGVDGDLLPIFRLRWSPATTTSHVKSNLPLDELSDRAFPQFLGPGRDARLPHLPVSDDWAENPPRLIWRRPVGAGWSSFAIVGDLAITQEQQGDQETVVAYRLADGHQLWRHSYPAAYGHVVSGLGPRATPTVAGDYVYSMGSTGWLTCLRVNDGSLIWKRQVFPEEAADPPVWGVSCSPLISDNQVVTCGSDTDGHFLFAFDKESGSPLWAAGQDRAAYSSPQLRQLAGHHLILMLNHASITAHSPQNGLLLWEEAWPGGQPNVAQPLVVPGDRLLVSSGYGVGSKMFRFHSRGDTISSELLWDSPRLKSKFANMIFHQEYIYGLDDGILTCLNPQTGQRQWKRGRYGHGQLLLSGDRLLILSEKGEVVWIDPQPDEHRELGRFQAVSGKTWNPPALAGRVLLVRNDREAACYRLPEPVTGQR